MFSDSFTLATRCFILTFSPYFISPSTNNEWCGDHIWMGAMRNVEYMFICLYFSISKVTDMCMMIDIFIMLIAKNIIKSTYRFIIII